MNEKEKSVLGFFRKKYAIWKDWTDYASKSKPDSYSYDVCGSCGGCGGGGCSGCAAEPKPDSLVD